jgi:hypothetical protein
MMCGSTKAPPVVKSSPKADAAAADADATKAANADLAQRRRELAQNSLLTIGAGGTDPRKKTPSLLSRAMPSAPGTSPKVPRLGNPKNPKFGLLDPGTGGRQTLGGL